MSTPPRRQQAALQLTRPAYGEVALVTPRYVLEDAADPSEGPVRITSGITYGPAPSLDELRVRLTLDALRRD